MAMVDLEVAGDVTERVRLEIIGLLARTVEVDLGTIYRALIGQFGSEVVADIGVVLSRLVCDGAIAVDTRQLSAGGPLIGIARLVLAIQPPYQALVA